MWSLNQWTNREDALRLATSLDAKTLCKLQNGKTDRLIERVLSAGTEEDDGTGYDDESEEDEADGVGAAGGGLNGLVAGQETEAVHFPDGDTFIHEFRVGGSQMTGHLDLIQHRV